ncbi:MAG: sigma-54-dependent Fis family transcriptional regulator, partial [Candidatus Rokuibacteriota bacterium]
KILIVVRRALEHQALGTELKALRNKLGQRDALRWLMGRGQDIQQVIQQIRQVANSNFTILIQGETGTGKELVARSIHQLSARRDKPFVPLDCGAIPETLIESELFGYEKGAFTGADRRKEGHFQLAEGGTLFLDEIVNLPFSTQAKLLRTLEERQVQVLGAKRSLPVDVRIIAAANVPLDREIRAGRFRQDLYYRLNEFVILVPPLRERIEDIIYLAERFLAEASMELRRPIRGISKEAVEVLLRYHWPGNVRELRNAIRRAVLLSSDLIEPVYLLPLPPSSSVEAPPADVSTFSPAQLSLKEMAGRAAAEAERWAIRQALRAAGGNKSEAARTLRTDYKTLHLKMRRHGIRSREFPGS